MRRVSVLLVAVALLATAFWLGSWFSTRSLWPSSLVSSGNTGVLRSEDAPLARAEQELLLVVNYHRVREGRPALLESEVLSEVTRQRGEDLARSGYLAQLDPAGRSIARQMLRHRGLPAQKAGELVIWVKTPDPRVHPNDFAVRVVEEWLDHPVNSKILLDGSYNLTGVAIVEMPQGFGVVLILGGIIHSRDHLAWGMTTGRGKTQSYLIPLFSFFMITYKYSLKRDLREAINILTDERKFLKNSNLVVFWPNPLRWLWLMYWIIFKQEKPQPNIDGDYTCYWLSSGTWGRYYAGTNAIGICPKDIKQVGLEDTIIHEIVHLQHPEADEMEHEEKEEYINQLSSKNE